LPLLLAWLVVLRALIRFSVPLSPRCLSSRLLLSVVVVVLLPLVLLRSFGLWLRLVGFGSLSPLVLVLLGCFLLVLPLVVSAVLVLVLGLLSPSLLVLGFPRWCSCRLVFRSLWRGRCGVLSLWVGACGSSLAVEVSSWGFAPFF
jgi:hypothetical protein